MLHTELNIYMVSLCKVRSSEIMGLTTLLLYAVTNILELFSRILAANSGLHVFDFLSNSILKEVLSSLQKGKPGVFSPGKPTEFLANYKSSLKFLGFLEGMRSYRQLL